MDLACQQLGVAADTVLRLQIPVGNSEQLNDPFPCPVTLRTALAHHTELLQHPDKQALEALATCCSSEVCTYFAHPLYTRPIHKTRCRGFVPGRYMDRGVRLLGFAVVLIGTTAE